jgi:hypothetical protein
MIADVTAATSASHVGLAPMTIVTMRIVVVTIIAVTATVSGSITSATFVAGLKICSNGGDAVACSCGHGVPAGSIAVAVIIDAMVLIGWAFSGAAGVLPAVISSLIV